MASPSAAETIFKQDTVIDLETFEEVTVRKEGQFVPAADVSQALARLGNDSAKHLKALNEFLKAEVRRTLGESAGGWYLLDENGKMTDQSFTGIQGDKLKYNAFVLNMAKMVAGYHKDMTPEQKEAARQAAIETIKATPVIWDGMKKNCAVDESAE